MGCVNSIRIMDGDAAVSLMLRVKCVWSSEHMMKKKRSGGPTSSCIPNVEGVDVDAAAAAVVVAVGRGDDGVLGVFAVLAWSLTEILAMFKVARKAFIHSKPPKICHFHTPKLTHNLQNRNKTVP